MTPHAQFPTGVALSADRRAALCKWAEVRDAWIVENGYESEFGLDGGRASPLFADASDRVIYVNSFHRVLFPGLRIGYLVAPESLIGPLAAARGVIDGHSNVVNQMVLQDFIAGGHLDDHIRSCREIYLHRRDCLASVLKGPLSEFLQPYPPGGCSHVVATVRGCEDARPVCDAAAEWGVDLTPMSQCLTPTLPDPRVLLGFAAFRQAAIQSASRQLLSFFQRGDGRTTSGRVGLTPPRGSATV